MSNRYFGSYDTRTFGEIFPTAADFIEAYKTNGLPLTITEDTANTLFYLLYARFGYSHLSNYNEMQAIYGIFSTIWQYGPAWEKRLTIQKELREMSQDELMASSKTIYNHAYNPSTAPSTSSLEELTHINDQNTANRRRSKIEAYGILQSMLESDVTEEFLRRFQKFFRKILAPDYPVVFASPDYSNNSNTNNSEEEVLLI